MAEFQKYNLSQSISMSQAMNRWEYLDNTYSERIWTFVDGSIPILKPTMGLVIDLITDNKSKPISSGEAKTEPPYSASTYDVVRVWHIESGYEYPRFLS